MVVCALIVAGAVAITSHWTLVPLGNGRIGALRLNRWTGEIVLCWPDGQSKVVCDAH